MRILQTSQLRLDGGKKNKNELLLCYSSSLVSTHCYMALKLSHCIKSKTEAKADGWMFPDPPHRWREIYYGMCDIQRFFILWSRAKYNVVLFWFGAAPFQIVVFTKVFGFDNNPTSVQSFFSNWTKQTGLGSLGNIWNITIIDLQPGIGFLMAYFLFGTIKHILLEGYEGELWVRPPLAWRSDSIVQLNFLLHQPLLFTNTDIY